MVKQWLTSYVKARSRRLAGSNTKAYKGRILELPPEGMLGMNLPIERLAVRHAITYLRGQSD